jgi:mannan endo-1,6-alpha-mannosidase
MLSYKAYLTRWMASSTKVAPFITARVMEVLTSSAKAAALQCSGSPADHPNGRMCGLSWSKGAQWDGTSGVGQQMAALEVVQSLLVKEANDPLSSNTGGTSVGDPGAGTQDPAAQDPTAKKLATTGDKAGAAILTLVTIGVVVAGLVWVSLPEGKII